MICRMACSTTHLHVGAPSRVRQQRVLGEHEAVNGHQRIVPEDGQQRGVLHRIQRPQRCPPLRAEVGCNTAPRVKASVNVGTALMRVYMGFNGVGQPGVLLARLRTH